MTTEHLPMVIIGAGHAGGRAALTLRAEGYRGPLLLIGDEAHLPYERPALSKGLLQGSVELAALSLCNPAQLAELDICHLAKVRVTRLAPEARCLHLSDGRQVHYQSLLLATGGQVRRLASLPSALGNVAYLRTHDDALALRERLQPGTRLVIVGGGFIGLEVAATARQLGCAVTLLEAGPHLAGRAVPQRVSQALLALHRSQGVDVHLNARFDVQHDGQTVDSLQLENGQSLACEQLVVGIGIEPNIQLAREAGLEVGQGIRVDACLATSAADVYAAGDVCEFRMQADGDFQRQETWRNAEDQGRHAALNMLGAGQPFQGMPGFWSDQYDWSLLTVGRLPTGSLLIARELPGEAFVLFSLDARQRLQGACGWGRGNSVAKDIKLCERLIAAGVPMNAESLADPTLSLKQLLRPAHA